MVEQAVFPFVASSSIKEDYPSIRIYYGGDAISEYEVKYTLFMDALFAIGSLSFVLFYLWFHTRAIVLSPIFLVIMFYSVPVAYVVSLAFGVNKVTIVSFLSI